MTEALDPELKRLRKLSPGELADKVGAVKAQISDFEAKLDGYKAEGVRRGLLEADGKLFRLAFTPPTTPVSSPQRRGWDRCVPGWQTSRRRGPGETWCR